MNRADAGLHPLMAVLVRHYGDLVENLRRRFGDRGLAHEVVHDVCVRLLAEPPREEIRSPQAFLHRVTTDLAIDRYRVETGRRAWVDVVEQLPEVAAPHADPQAQLVARQTLDALQRTIEALPTRCREVFILHKLHDLPQQLIAERLGISRNMVTQHVARAMQAVRPVIAGHADGWEH